MAQQSGELYVGRDVFLPIVSVTLPVVADLGLELRDARVIRMR